MGQVKCKISASAFRELGDKLHNENDIYFSDSGLFMQINKYDLEEDPECMNAILIVDWYSEDDIRVGDGQGDVETFSDLEQLIKSYC